MSFIARLRRAREILEQQGRLSTRALERELGIGGDELAELIEELVDVQQVARREGKVLVWDAPATTPPKAAPDRRAGTAPPLPTADEVGARKVVTVVFADLVGSTSLHERLDAESARGLMDRYYRALGAAVDAHGGRVVKLLGDGVMAAFGVPRVAEDDAIRAVRAAIGMQQAFRDEVTGSMGGTAAVGLRVAVNTGEVVLSADNSDVVGDPVNVAARLQQEARDGEVLLGEATQRLVRELVTLAPAGTFSLKGRAEPVRAYRVVSLDRPAGAAATAFVGRDEELGRVTAVYDAAVAAPGVRLAVVLGSPGLGKSRLLAEFGRRLGDGATVLTARCDPAGGGTFAPLAEALRAHFGLEAAGRGDALGAAIDAVVPGPEGDRARIAGGIGALLAGTPATPEETFFVVRRFLGALATAQPVVLAIDDLQWAEPLLLDLVEHLVQWGTGVRLLVLAAARPDLRDVRSSLTRTGELVSDVVTLAGLDAAAATRLAANVIGAEVLPAAVAGRVLATSEGNPLFVGELVRMLVNDGALRQEGDRWTAAVELATVEMPPTIHALLAARIERLGAEERTVLERAAVIGRQFSRAAVAHLLPAELRAHLDARLEALRRSELIEPDTAWFLGEPALRFHHGLTRDAAYRRVLKGTRAELHGRVADWIEGRGGEAIEHDETIGWHLEQAHQHLRELGPLDTHGRALGARAARHLGAAGRRALGRDDLPVAANLLGRALALLEAADPARADLALDWCEALLAAGEVGPAAEAIAELGRLVETPGPEGPTERARRLRAWHACFAGEHAALTDPQALRATTDAVAAAAKTLAAVGDAAGEAKAHSVHALALGRLGRVGACEAALDLALAAARRARDRRRANTVLAGAPLAALWGPSPVTRASGRCLDVVRVLRITQGAPAVEAVALRCQAVLEALRGRAEAARRMIAASRRMVEELGITQGLLETEWFAGLVALFEGDTAAAAESLRAAYDGFRRHGLGIDAARAAALLGIALLAQGRAAEAETLSHESEALAGDDLQAAITWRRVRAEALARRGERTAAIDFARAAVEIAAATDALLHHADARLALAAALRAAGRRDEAAAEEAHATRLWEAKGATVLLERGRRGDGHVVPGAQGTGTPAAALAAVQRRIRPNAASALAARFADALHSRDLDAVAALCGEHMETVDHPTGATYGREGTLDSVRRMLRATHFEFRVEPLATLGESLCLCRRLATGNAVVGKDFDVAAYEVEHLLIYEVDRVGRYGRSEVFAADHLDRAIRRLYERYAELLPDGPERARAAATARAVTAPAGPVTFERLGAIIGPAVEFVDHRPLGLPSSRGREAYLGSLHAFLETVEESANRWDDVLALRADGYLLRVLNFGTERSSGGAFERPILLLALFDADSLVTHWEFFAPDREDEALARFDALTAGPSPARLPPPVPAATRAARRVRPNGATANAASFETAIADRDVDTITTHVAATGEGFGDPLPAAPTPPERRRVRANAASATTARMDAAIGARDIEAFLALWADDCEIVDHPTGSTYDRRGLDAMWRSAFLRVPDLTIRRDEIATLGEALCLSRQWVRGSASAGGRFDVGAYEIGHVVLNEVDARGWCRRSEGFAIDRLGDAVVRLYERHAELLPEGPERTRIAATARAIATQVGPLELGRFVSAVAPAVEYVDHRRLIGLEPIHGARAFRDAFRALFEAADDMTNRVDDVLALSSDALLVRVTNTGRAHVGGGTYERPLLVLLVFGADGLQTRVEAFDPEHEAEAVARWDTLTGEPPVPPPPEVFEADREAEALARFDALAGERAPAPTVLRRVRPNAATAHAARADAAVAARDGGALRGLIADDHETIDHTTGAAYGREGALASFDALLRARGPTCRHEPLATLGDGLALCRMSISATGFAGRTFDVGAWDKEVLVLYEVDAHGRRRRADIFAADRLGDAVARLYGRHAELLPEGPGRRAAATARAVAALPLLAQDLERVAAALAPAVEVIDHRILGTWSAHGAEAVLANARSIREIGDDVTVRTDDVLALRPDALLAHVTHLGSATASAGGGTFEVPHLALFAFGPDGLLTRIETFDADREAEALERWDALTAERPPAASTPARIENAATRTADRVEEAWQARDWEGYAALFAPGFRCFDRRKRMLIELDRTQYIESYRPFFDMRSSVPRNEVLATRGRRLALVHVSWEGADDLVGPSELEWLMLSEVDDAGRRVAVVNFDPDALDAAHAELDERYAAGEAAPHAAGWQWSLRFFRALAARDWEQFASVFAPDFVVEDHRPLGLLGSLSRDEYVASVRALLGLRRDATFRLEHVLAQEDRRSLAVGRWAGGEPEGTFEIPVVNAVDFGPDGARRYHFYNLDQLDEAWARFEALGDSGRAGDASDGGRSDAASDPLRIPPNAATRAADRWVECGEARDWGRLATLFAPTLVFEDRRRLLRTTGDRDMAIASTREIASAGARPLRTLLATAGHRLALERIRFVAGDAGSQIEVDSLHLSEVDAEGRVVAVVIFDPDDRRAASAEMLDRYARSEAARGIPAALFDALRALNAHDLGRLRTLLPDDFVMHDRRRTGLGRLERADDYLASLAALIAESPDVATEILYVVAVEKHGMLVLARNFGTLRDGGEFESVYGRIGLVRNDRLVGGEMFEPEDLPAARVRFAAMRGNGEQGELRP